MVKEPEQIRKELAAFFAAEEVEWKPQTVKGNRALAIAYIDARCVMDRLDAVVGVENWQDSYHLLPDGSAECTLALRINGEWISKADVGTECDQGDDGNKRKAAYSDGLKRAAVKWGIGRYLYSLDKQWVDFDPQKKQFVSKPQLPAKFLPGGKPAPKQAEPKPEPAHDSKLPKDGKEFEKRLFTYEATLAKQGVCAVGELSKYLLANGKPRGYPEKLSDWAEDAIANGAVWTREFEAAKRANMQRKSA